MLGMVIVTHGDLAQGLLQAARMIIGEVPAAVSVALQEEQGIDSLQGQIEKALANVDQGDGVLIFVDMVGASPFNVSSQISSMRQDVEVITGVNLPMLLETALQRDNQSFDELAATALDAGRASIHTLTDLLNASS
jgi:mannose/fructose/sorbose-specific phosphotransferase system IIA component